MPASSRRARYLLLLLLLLGGLLRLYDLDDEPIDFHPTRQLRGAIVARGIYYALNPAFDQELRQRAIAFEQSTGQYEPPLLESAVALTCLAFRGGTAQECPYVPIGRIYNTALWLLGGLALYALARRLSGTDAALDAPALISLAYYLILPFSVQASRSFQPDPAMTAWLLLAAYALVHWAESLTEGGQPSWKWAVLAGLLAGLAILTKAVAAYAMAGAALAAAVVSLGSLRRLLTHGWRQGQLWVIASLMVAPTALYYLSRGGRAAEYFSSWTVALSHLLLEPTFYLRWLNLLQELFGWLALILAFGGLLFSLRLMRRPAQENPAGQPRRAGAVAAVLLGLWLGYCAYGLFLPYQMYTHSYYHLQLVPMVALALTPAVQQIAQQLSRRSRWLPALSTALILLWGAYLAWQALIPFYSQDYRGEPAYWQGIAAQLPNDGKVIALTQDYGYRLMYYGWRKVTLWPNRGEFKVMSLRGSDKEFQEFFAKRIEGKDYFLITAFNQYNSQPNLQQVLTENYPILQQGSGYLIFDLRQTLSAP